MASSIGLFSLVKADLRTNGCATTITCRLSSRAFTGTEGKRGKEATGSPVGTHRVMMRSLPLPGCRLWNARLLWTLVNIDWAEQNNSASLDLALWPWTPRPIFTYYHLLTIAKGIEVITEITGVPDRIKGKQATSWYTYIKNTQANENKSLYPLHVLYL